METKDTCLYIHTRKSDGGIFYVGIGDSKRPYDKTSRNIHWKRIVNKYGYEVKVLKTGMSWEKACDLETLMISFYGRIRPSKKNPNYGCLVNMTDGGDGAKGAIISEEHKQKIRENNLKNGNRPPSAKGRKATEETKKKMSGENNHFFNKTHNEKSLKKMRGENHLASKKVICIITGKIYACVREAAEVNEIKYGTLKDWLKGRYSNKSSLRYL